MFKKIFIVLLVLILLPLGIKAMVSDEFTVNGNVEGVVGFALEDNTVDLELSGTSFEFDTTAITLDMDISDWFTNLPSGLSATVLDFDFDYVTAEFNGVYDSVIDEQISVTIPQAFLDGYSDDLDNTPSDDAKFISTHNPSAIYHGPYTVSGVVGTPITEQIVVIELDEVIEDTDIYDLSITYTNGLTGKATNIIPNGTYGKLLTITFSGTPTMVDHSEIEYIVYKDKVLYISSDLVVPNRADVVFNITTSNTTPPTTPEVPHIPPKTGIE